MLFCLCGNKVTTCRSKSSSERILCTYNYNFLYLIAINLVLCIDHFLTVFLLCTCFAQKTKRVIKYMHVPRNVITSLITFLLVM